MAKKKKVKAQLIDLKGRDVITTQEFTVPELEAVLKLAMEMKKNRYCEAHTKYMRNQTFTMFFYNPSLRTRQSFEAAATELSIPRLISIGLKPEVTALSPCR